MTVPPAFASAPAAVRGRGAWASLLRFGLLGFGLLRFGRRLVGDPDETGQRRGCRLRVVEEDERRVDRREQAVEVERGGRRGADGHRPAAYEQEPGDEDGREPRVLGDVQPVVEVQHQPYATQRQFDRRRRPPGHPLGVLLLQPERPYGAGARDGVQELLLLGPGGDPLPGVERHGVAYVPPRGGRLDGHRDERGEEEPPVQGRHRGQGQCDGQQGAGQFGQRVAHRLAHHRDVPGDTRGEVSGARLLDLFQGQPQRLLHEAFAQPSQYGLAEPGDEGQAQRGGRALGEGDQDQQDDRESDVSRRAVVGDDVHDAAQQRLDQQAHTGGHDHRREAGDRQAPARTDELADRGAGAGRGRGGQQLAAGGFRTEAARRAVAGGPAGRSRGRCVGGVAHASTAVR